MIPSKLRLEYPSLVAKTIKSIADVHYGAQTTADTDGLRPWKFVMVPYLFFLSVLHWTWYMKLATPEDVSVQVSEKSAGGGIGYGLKRLFGF